MGVGLLMTTANGFKVLPLEGGHVSFNPCAPSDPRRDEETDMINFLSAKMCASYFIYDLPKTKHLYT